MTNEELVIRIQRETDKNRDLELLFRQNIGFVQKIAKPFQGFAEEDDLLQEGMIGLLEAAERWSEKGNASFLQYASFWIKKNMLRYIENCGSTVRVPVNQHARIRAYRRIVANFTKAHKREPTKEELCKLLDLKPDQIEGVLMSINMMAMYSLDASLPYLESEGKSLAETIPDPDDVIEQLEDDIQREQLGKIIWSIIMDVVSEQECEILRARYKHKLTLHQCAAKMNKSPARIWQIERSALRKVRKSKDAAVLREFLFLDDMIEAAAYHGTGLKNFQRTGTSAPERVILRMLDSKEDEDSSTDGAIIGP